MVGQFVDIHCHLLPGIDDGADNLEESLAMARMAATDGIGTIIATPHQLGNFAENRGPDIRDRVERFQQELDRQQIPLRVMPGADVRIDENMLQGLKRGEVLTLADQRRHVLLELPHELYFPLEPVLDQLAGMQLVGILSHPERNQGILRAPQVLGPLVDAGCLLQVTAGSLLGGFGPASRELAETLVQQGLVHFLATDAHGLRSRRPLLARAYTAVSRLADEQTANELCCVNPAHVAAGRPVTSGRRTVSRRRSRWLSFRKVTS